MRTTWTFHSATELLFGVDAVAMLGDRLREMSLRRLFVVTDKVLVSAGVWDTVRRPLLEAGVTIELFDRCVPEPSLDVAEEAISQARSFGPDSVLGLGGGSNMDLAKIVATVVTHGGSPRDYLGDSRVPGPVMPIICVATTAGTGSEVTGAAVLTDVAAKIKVSTLSNYQRPRLAVVDPRLTLSCPAKVTADSGIDALTHAIEAFTAVDNEVFPLPTGERSVYQGRNPLADCFAERAISLVGQHLVQAVREPNNLAAREGMALAATLAGLAFSNAGVALVHAMEYPVGGAVHVSHGAGNGLLLPFVMRFNLPCRVRELARVAELLGAPPAEANLTPEAAAERAIAAVEHLKVAIGIPARLRDLGVERTQLPEFAEKAAAIKRILRVNPRPVTVADIQSIYEAAW